MSAARPAPNLSELFLGFASVSALAFGGVLPWARHVLVDTRGWLTDDEFVDTLALSQFLPGPNIVNMSVAIGARFQGAPGSVAAFLGLMMLPVAIVLVLVTAYAQVATVPAVRGALAGMAAAAAGLVIGMALRLLSPLLRRRLVAAGPFVFLTFVAVALLRLPLWLVIGALAPLSILFGWRVR